ncbi:MAG TPA: hypothetical protein VM692_12825, partial [Gammaproteobacteria bacterium]|nr:hypothetical protein [Gammaproteobacteria bacterium]
YAEGPAAGPSSASETTTAEPSTAAAPQADGDVVRLKNGGLLRGKVSELIPGDSVTIVTLTGKVREFPMSEVEYAGPAAQDPKRSAPSVDVSTAQKQPESVSADIAKPYVTVHGREARVKLVSDTDGVTFYRQTGSAFAVGAGGSAFATGYERICAAPCEVSLPAGTETLALGRGDKAPRAAEPVTLPAGVSEVRGTFQSRAGVRVGGWIILVGGAIVGSVLMATAMDSEQSCDLGVCYETTEFDGARFLAGTLILGAGVGIGLGMGLMRDKALISVHPQRSSAERSLVSARGASFYGSF